MSFFTLHVVKVTNTNDEILNIPYLGQVLQIPPGESRTVPWDAACGVFGNPLVVNRPNNPERNDVHNQTRALWGFSIGYDTETEAQRDKQPAARRELASSWEAKAPHFEVHTVDTNQRILMVLDDPTGALANPGLDGGELVETFDPVTSAAQIRDLQSQLATLTNLFHAKFAADATDTPAVAPYVTAEPPEPVADDSTSAGSVTIPRPVAINTNDTPSNKRK